jgi:hypothetical protein
MTGSTVANQGGTTPITDAVYGKKPRRKAPASVTRNPRHTFRAQLDADTVDALERLKGKLIRKQGRRR